MIDKQTHISNIYDNLQLLADLGCCMTSLFVATEEGYQVLATAQPATAAILAPARSVGDFAVVRDEEINACFSKGALQKGKRLQRVKDAVSFSTHAYPIGLSETYAVIARDIPAIIYDCLGPMEDAFIGAAVALNEFLGTRILSYKDTDRPFSTTRSAGDGICILDDFGNVNYSSPNLAGILRKAQGAIAETLYGIKGLPEEEIELIADLLKDKKCVAGDVQVGDRVHYRRFVPFVQGGIILVEDVSRHRAHERELRVKEATIREMHHRVKNNLQSIESLLRIQMRRSQNDSVRAALTEATMRIEAMAVVHEMLSVSEDEHVYIAQMARTVADRVRLSMTGVYGGEFSIGVHGDAGRMDAHSASSLAIALTEMLQNAIEHGFEGQPEGRIEVMFRRTAREIEVSITDNGRGLPEDFSLDGTQSIGLTLIKAMIEDDLGAALEYGSSKAGGALFRIVIPASDGVSDSEGGGEV
ncbi:MAG: sensor histidine kinase [Actinobacteria bacterium]|nr:sensor histidine kinase [Actinomycetota bacterium]